MKKISSTEAVRSFGDVLARVRHTGESILICKNDKPVASLGPPPGNARSSVSEFIEAWQSLPLDAEFASDLKAISEEDQPLDNPWGS